MYNVKKRISKVFKLLLVSITLLCHGLIRTTDAGEVISSTNSFIENLVGQYKRNNTIMLSIPANGVIDIDIKYHSYKDGYLSMGGSVSNIPQSQFIIKGTNENIYGWIHLVDEVFENGLVYKYSTDAKKTVRVAVVPVSDIISINNMSYSSGGSSSYTPSPLQQDLPNISHIKPLANNMSLNELQSKPQSKKVLWMDIREMMNGEEPITATREEIWYMWQIVSSGFETYDINVTTSKAVYDATPDQNRGYGIHHDTEGRSHCAYDVFGSEGHCTIYRPANGFIGGRSALHEYGHLVGIDDQGTGLNGVQWATYFPGYDELKWVPIMGNFLYSDDWGEETLYQWSNGDYKAGTQAVGMPQEDVLELITDFLEVESDDIPTSKPLDIKDGSVSMATNYGMINTVIGGLDEDDFTFEVSDRSNVDLTIDRIGHIAGAMMDVHASLLDNSGNVLVEDNQPVARYAKIKTNLEPGKYTLRISGGTEGDTDIGFPRYGSIGHFGISGTISNGITGTVNNDLKKNFFGISQNDNILQLIGLDNNDKVSVSVYNVSGRKVLKKIMIGNSSLTLNSFLDNGYYVLRITEGSRTHVKRIVLSK